MVLLIILLCFMTIAAHSLSLKQVVELQGKESDSFVYEVFQALGGKEELEAEINFALTEASSLRNGTAVSSVDFLLGNTIVMKICFSDNHCWAAKMRNPTEWYADTFRGIAATVAIRIFCPQIPVSTWINCKTRTYEFCYSHWIEGESLQDRMASLQRQGSFRNLYTQKVSEKTITSLAGFVYNLTTCPISEVCLNELRTDDLSVWLRKRINGERLNATTWAERQFFRWHLLANFDRVKPYDAFDDMLLLSWVLKKLSTTNEDPRFVLVHWDLRPPNIIIGENDELVGIIDWDNVIPVPYKLAAISLEETLKLDKTQVRFFRQEVSRIEWEQSSSTEFSQMLEKSEETKFLYDILLPQTQSNIDGLWKKYPDLYKEAIHPSDEKIELATKEWSRFTEELYLRYNLSVPRYPKYVEIQEHLGIYGQTEWERKVRRMKRIAYRRWNGFWYGIIHESRWALLGKKPCRAY